MYQLYLVTQNYTDIDFLKTIEQACQSGITLIQLREKNLTTRAFFDQAKAVKHITDKYGVPLIINDRIDICLAVNADGVHIGNDELPVEIVRKLLPNKIIGVTAKTVERAKEAMQQGADYLGVGAIYQTATKNTAVISIETLKAIVQAVSIPVVAIGGLTLNNMSILQKTGIRGVALVSEIMKANDVVERVKCLKKAVKEIVYD